MVGHEGTWLFGPQTQQLGVLMPTHPKVGDKFQAENVPNVTREEDEVISVAKTVTIGSHTYRDCVEIKENLSDGKIEHKFYAPGVGCIKEAETDGSLELEHHEVQLTR